MSQTPFHKFLIRLISFLFTFQKLIQRFLILIGGKLMKFLESDGLECGGIGLSSIDDEAWLRQQFGVMCG